MSAEVTIFDLATRAEVRRMLGEPRVGRRIVVTSTEEVATFLLAELSSTRLELKRSIMLSLAELSATQTSLASAVFRRVIAPPGVSLLPAEELVEALRADNAKDLLIGVSYDPGAQALQLVRGDGTSLVVSSKSFVPSGKGLSPDFSAPRVTDYGQTLRLGEYEAASDAILYEHDAAARRRMRRRERDQDTSLGGSIRRLRLQRRLTQDDFGELDARTLRRIENGEIQNPHRSTVASIAGVLGVSVDDLGSY